MIGSRIMSLLFPSRFPDGSRKKVQEAVAAMAGASDEAVKANDRLATKASVSKLSAETISESVEARAVESEERIKRRRQDPRLKAAQGVLKLIERH